MLEQHHCVFAFLAELPTDFGAGPLLWPFDDLSAHATGWIRLEDLHIEPVVATKAEADRVAIHRRDPGSQRVRPSRVVSAM